MRIILITITLTVAVLMANGQTAVPGGTVSGTWGLEGSPYRVQGSIMVTQDSTLTIEPGVTVEFLGHYKLLVKGRLLAAGTPGNTITFTGDPSAGWYGIRFDNTAEASDTSKLLYCDIEWGKATGSENDASGGGIMINNFSKIIISHSSIKNNTSTYGGGMAIMNSNLVISNNVISDNTAEYGGGIYCNNSNPSITDNTVSGNLATSGGGGGILCSSSSPEISNNLITHNEANAGGGIYCSDGGSNPVIIYNTVQNNSARGYNGGGIYLDAGSSGTVSYNTISHNHALFGGGGIVCFSNNPGPEISYNFIFSNHAQNGGGIECYPESNPTISNNVITNNSASTNGGGIDFYSSAILTNNTIASNSAGSKGSALSFTNASAATFRNCIIYNDTTHLPMEYVIPAVYINDEGSDPDFYFCDISGGRAAFDMNDNFYTGTYQNNIDADPNFVAPSSSGVPAYWKLLTTSPCINAGDPNGTYPALDAAGNPRVFADTVDIGAFEYPYPAGIVNRPQEFEIKVYPNPFSEGASIQMPANAINSVLNIYNLYGQKVKTMRHISGTQINIERGDLKSGIYFYELKKDKLILSKGNLIIID